MHLMVLLSFALLMEFGHVQGLDYRQVVEQVLPAVVTITGQTADGEVVGSGFLVDSSGTVITSLHVVSSLRTIRIKLTNGDVYDSVKVKAFDKRRDLAILRISGFGLPVAPLGNSNDVKQGEPVLLVGAGSGLQGSVSSGIVSAVRDLPDGFRVIQTDAAANPGNSGGPLCNSRSEVIGILGFKVKGSEGQSFAIPINYARGLLENANGDLELSALQAETEELLTNRKVLRGVENIRDVRLVFVARFGVTEAAFLVREKLVNRLSLNRAFEVINDSAEADAVLDGYVSSDALGRADASVFRLVGKSGKVLWGAEYTSGTWGWGRSASSHIANKAADDLMKAAGKKK